MNQRYDFYADMLETHTEIGYLLVIAISLLAFNAATAVVLWRWPNDDVYLVPGVESGGTADITWGATPPPIHVVEAHEPPDGPPTIALPAGQGAPGDGSAAADPATAPAAAEHSSGAAADEAPAAAAPVAPVPGRTP